MLRNRGEKEVMKGMKEAREWAEPLRCRAGLAQRKVLSNVGVLERWDGESVQEAAFRAAVAVLYR
jgi:hypothetical protein